MNMDYDVIIVGARVAGAVLATRLGQLGHRVLVLEKATFPSPALSTSIFRAPALRVFEQIGVLREVAAMAPKLKILWNYIDGQVVSAPVEAEEKHLRFFLSERRVTLDWILYERMQQETTLDIHLNAKVKELLWVGGRVIGVRWQESSGAYEATAKVVVGADGFYSKIANLLQPPYERYTPVQRFMYYAYFNNLDSFDVPAAEHHFVGNTAGYIFPTDGDLTLAAVSLPIADFKAFKQAPLKNMLAYLESLPLLKARLKDAELASPVFGSGNIPSYQRLPYGSGWALVGDAQQVMDPWSGMGIDHATTHASYLAEALNIWLKEYTSWKVAMADYYLRARSFSERGYRRTTDFAADLRPMLNAALERRGLISNRISLPVPTHL